jgi:hypothetical protein
MAASSSLLSLSLEATETKDPVSSNAVQAVTLYKGNEEIKSGKDSSNSNDNKGLNDYFCSAMILPPSRNIADLSEGLKIDIFTRFENLTEHGAINTPEVAEWLKNRIVNHPDDQRNTEWITEKHRMDNRVA